VLWDTVKGTAHTTGHARGYRRGDPVRQQLVWPCARRRSALRKAERGPWPRVGLLEREHDLGAVHGPGAVVGGDRLEERRHLHRDDA